MKIIHCADLHLNSKMETRFDLAKSVARRKEILSTFVKMVEYADSNNVQVIVFAGDTFDHSKITKETKDIFLKTIENYPNISMLYLAGNHDEKVMFGDDIPNNLKIFDDSWTTFKFDQVSISGIELTKENYLVAGKNLNLDSQDKNIVVLHGQVVNTNPSNPDEINIKEYKNKNIDYLALGHIHSYRQEQLDDRGVFCYSGTLEGRGFDELGQKGFSLIEIKNNKLTSKFIPFCSREIEIVKVDINDIENQFELQNKITKELKSIDKKNIVRVELVGEVSPTLNKNLDIIKQELEKEFYFVEISDKKLKIKISDIDTKSVSLISEFSKLVLDSKLDDSQKEYIISLGFKALNGEDIEI